MDSAFLLILAVSIAYGVGCLGRNRRIGFGWAFILSLLNVFVGLIAVFLSKKINRDGIDKEEKEGEQR